MPLPCLLLALQHSPMVVHVKWLCINGELPPLPLQEYQSDGGAHLFAPRSIHICPSQRALVDTGLAYAFPHSHWYLMKNKSSLALRHSLTVLGGVVDSNYRGCIQLILCKWGSQPITITRGTPMCQAILIS